MGGDGVADVGEPCSSAERLLREAFTMGYGGVA
jgi:hypothetical protein